MGLRQILVEAGIESAMLDALVDDAASREASRINNEGMKEQLDYLERIGVAEEEILSTLGVGNNSDFREAIIEGDILIDGILIDPAVFDNEVVYWCLEDRLSWISEINSIERDNRGPYLTEILAALQCSDDKFFWFNTKTNKHVSPSKKRAKANDICEAVLLANSNLLKGIRQ